MPHIVFLVSLESFQQGGVHGLVPWCLDLHQHLIGEGFISH
jgi:hypothetical protein